MTWALAHIAAPTSVLDAACGPGADTLTLADALPSAEILAVDKQSRFVAAARVRCEGFQDRVSCVEGDMFEAKGPFDLIWCAGAVYFAGVSEALARFKGQLAAGGHVAFSEPLAPGKDAPASAHQFWDDYQALTDEAGIQEHIQNAGFETIATRVIKGAPWNAYYTPMQARINMLRASSQDPELEKVLNECQREIDLWRSAPDDIAYLLCLTRPHAE